MDREEVSLTKRLRYRERLVNSFAPRWVHAVRPSMRWSAKYWRSRSAQDPHGPDVYVHSRAADAVLVQEIQRCTDPADAVLELACNAGYYLNLLQGHGYTDLCGIDINSKALTFGAAHFGLEGVRLVEGDFSDALRLLRIEGAHYRTIFSYGASIELASPRRDVIKNICRVAEENIVLIISEAGHVTPRFYEAEFNRHGFLLTKLLRPYDGGSTISQDVSSIQSLLVFRRMSGSPG